MYLKIYYFLKKKNKNWSNLKLKKKEVEIPISYTFFMDYVVRRKKRVSQCGFSMVHMSNNGDISNILSIRLVLLNLLNEPFA